MIRLRPFLEKDAETILSFYRDERTFYQWTAGVLGSYPLTKEQFLGVRSLMAFTAMDEKEVIGFFTMRNPRDTMDEVRIGFVIVSPERRGKGYGKAMLKLALTYAREIYGAKTVSLGVFENNPAAYHCYRAAGFSDIEVTEPEAYTVMGETWPCKELSITFAG